MVAIGPFMRMEGRALVNGNSREKAQKAHKDESFCASCVFSRLFHYIPSCGLLCNAPQPLWRHKNSSRTTVPDYRFTHKRNLPRRSDVNKSKVVSGQLALQDAIVPNDPALQSPK